MKILDCIAELTGQQRTVPGGHNWPDMELVIDPAQTDVVDDEIYLLQIQQRDPVVKRLKNKSEAELWLHPAVATIHDAGKHATLFGKKLPIQSIEFSDNIYRRFITVHGKVVGVWAGV